MGIFSTIVSVFKEVAPVAWDNAIRPLGDWVVQYLKNMDDVAMTHGSVYDSTTLAGVNSAMDAPIDDKERKQEEVLVVTQADI